MIVSGVGLCGDPAAAAVHQATDHGSDRQLVARGERLGGDGVEPDEADAGPAEPGDERLERRQQAPALHLGVEGEDVDARPNRSRERSRKVRHSPEKLVHRGHGGRHLER